MASARRTCRHDITQPHRAPIRAHRQWCNQTRRIRDQSAQLHTEYRVLSTDTRYPPTWVGKVTDNRLSTQKLTSICARSPPTFHSELWWLRSKIVRRRTRNPALATQMKTTASTKTCNGAVCLPNSRSTAATTPRIMTQAFAKMDNCTRHAPATGISHCCPRTRRTITAETLCTASEQRFSPRIFVQTTLGVSCEC